jgi:hypothetical protein
VDKVRFLFFYPAFSGQNGWCDMKIAARFARVCFVMLVFILISFGVADAKYEIFKQEKENHPDLKCATCHIAPVPKKGDEDKRLNETGKFYQKNKSFPASVDKK